MSFRARIASSIAYVASSIAFAAKSTASRASASAHSARSSVVSRSSAALASSMCGAIVGVLARFVDLGFQLGLAFRSGRSDAALGLLDLV